MAALGVGACRAGFLVLFAAAGAAGEPPPATIERPNLGLNMNLGGLYNAAEEVPVAGYLCEDAVIQRHRRVLATPSLTQEYVTDDRMSSKMDLLDVKGELSFKMMALVSIDVHGSAAFLKHTVRDRKEVRMAYKSEAVRETEMLDVFNPEVLRSVRPRAPAGATHVVTGVVYGQRTVATFASSYTNDIDKMEIEGNLSAALSYAVFTGELSVALHTDDDTESNRSSIKTSIYSDNVPEEFPIEPAAVFEFAKTAHLRPWTAVAGSKSDNSSGDPVAAAYRGVPLRYVLTPLVQLAPAGAPPVVQDVETQFLEEARVVFDKLDDSGALLEEMLSEEDNGNPAWRAEAARYAGAFRSWKAYFLGELSQAVAAARQGTPSDIPGALAKYYNGRFSDTAVAVRVQEFLAALAGWRAVAAALTGRGVAVATSAAEISAASLDPTHNATYLLVLVDEGGYNGAEVRAFAAFAQGKLRVADEPDAGHCTLRADEREQPVCTDSMMLMAADFNSYCAALCPARYCFTHRPSARASPERACRTRQQQPGGCRVSAEEARAQQCWRRPAADNSSRIGGMDAFTDEWCACPATVVVKFENDGTERPIITPVAPRRPRVEDVIDAVEESDPLHQAVDVVIEEGDAADGVLYYKINVLNDRFDNETRRWSVVERTVTTTTNNRTVRIAGLRAGATYRFEAIAVNEIGPSAPSDPRGPHTQVRIRGSSATVTVVSWTSLDGEVHEFPAGVLEGLLPSWRVGNGAWLDIHVEASAPGTGDLAGVRFQSVNDSGVVFHCENAANATLSALDCSIPLADLTVGDPVADVAFHVLAVDAAGMVQASGSVLRLAASVYACGLFEFEGRLELCEARLVTAVADETQDDPLNQRVTLTLSRGAYARPDTFHGWVVQATEVGGAGPPATARVVGNEGEIAVGGLRAGARYTFVLRALRGDATLSEESPAFPHFGYVVRYIMPVLTPQAPLLAPRMVGLRNHVPGWRAYGSGLYFLRVALTLPAAAFIDRVLFVSEDGRREATCLFYNAKALDSVECAVPVGQLSEGFGVRMKVEVFDEGGFLLAQGVAIREEISGEACAEWEPATPLHCEIDDVDGLDVSKCVADCGACAAGGWVTVPHANACQLNACKAGQVLCPGDAADACFDRLDEPDGGCGAVCFDAVLGEMGGRAVCIPPCEVSPGVTIPPGTTADAKCPPHSVVHPPAPRRRVACPALNKHRYPKNAATGQPTPWAVGAVPECERCTVDRHCNGRARRAAPNAGQTACECQCFEGYTGTACDHCAETHYRTGSGECGACTGDAACHGHADAAELDVAAAVCACTCTPRYAGPQCERCSQDHYGGGYPQCEACNDCNGHAVNISDSSLEKCVCRCQAGYAGTRCQRCAEGFGPRYPKCAPSFVVNGTGVRCPTGAAPQRFYAPKARVPNGGCEAGGAAEGYALEDVPTCTRCVETPPTQLAPGKKTCKAVPGRHSYKQGTHTALLCAAMSQTQPPSS
eukprot:TRINITY_DN18542_c0_g1_i1.p1 TRINITY_DN18542_c0_g1~~TRINITY_DN18542_c0_g1_i1.p1  ORF type:complete len:1490 (+),score=433.60 TRINITY_DN18542_c0_g1_i1:45-4514(+)